jgi:hypothetical protein
MLVAFLTLACGQQPAFQDVKSEEQNQRGEAADALGSGKDAANGEAGGNAAGTSPGGADNEVVVDVVGKDSLPNGADQAANVGTTGSSGGSTNIATTGSTSGSGGGTSTASTDSTTGGTTTGGTKTSGVGANLSGVSDCRKGDWPASAKVAFVSERKDQAITADSVLGIHVAGNKSAFTLTVGSKSAESLRGVCLFITGNQSNVTIKVGANIGEILVISRGHLSRTLIEVGEDYKVGSIKTDILGKDGRVEVKGDGSYPAI